MLNSQDGPGHGECDVFVAPDGNVKEVLCYDYGFRSGFGRLYQGGDGEIPKGFFALARPTPYSLARHFMPGISVVDRHLCVYVWICSFMLIWETCKSLFAFPGAVDTCQYEC